MSALTQKARYERNKANGICVRCVVEPAKTGGVLCETCLLKERTRVKVYSDAHREERRRKGRTYGKSLRGKFSSYKSEAKHFGRVFLLSLEDFAELWQKPCSFCGDPIETIGIDRIDNSKGYEKSNIHPCCGPCNKMRNKTPVPDFLDRVQKIARRIQEGLVS